MVKFQGQYDHRVIASSMENTESAWHEPSQNSAVSEDSGQSLDETLNVNLPANAIETGTWDNIVASLPEPFAGALSLGGPVTLILALLSIVALAVILFKSVQLLIERSRGRQLIDQSLQLWHRGENQRAINVLNDSQQGVARLVRVAMQGCESRDAPQSLVREEVQRLADKDIQSLRSHLRTLEVIGNLSPLLGLFGTVLGMIEAFRQMEAAGVNVDPSVLSGGIWQALLTTGVGLGVAIPSVLAFQFLDQRAERHAQRIENSVTQVFTARVHQPYASSANPSNTSSTQAGRGRAA